MNFSPESPVLEVKNLRVSFATTEGVVGAVQNVSFSIQRGRTLALVGESGAGKSVTAHAILRLIQPPGEIVGGRVLLRSRRAGEIDIGHLDERSGLLFQVRGGLVSMIFQEPMAALSPLHTIGGQIDEAILLHQDVSPAAARRLTLEMLHKVGIADAERRYGQFPHELSGGLRQRAVIAMALVCRPELLIADEPTTAVDVTLQAQILGLIKSLQREIGCAVLLITHDFGVVAQMADEVAVMRRGEIVERGDVRAVLKQPQHAYTRALLDALPSRQGAGATRAEAPPESWSRAEKGEVSMHVSSGPPEPLAPPVSPLLAVRKLSKHFPIYAGGVRRQTIGWARALDEVSFEVAPGETLGLVGESGSGKTTAARCILRALEPSAGEVWLRLPEGHAVDLARLSERELKPLRAHAQMVFQDPYSSLNPRMTVGEIVAEPLTIHRLARGRALEDRVVQMLESVGLKAEHCARYPHAFSGGQRQRIGIARALIMRPSLLVCDEATSALDVSVQAQVLDLLKRLQREFRLTYLFVAHNLDVVRNFCDRVAVMRQGRIVETAPTAQIFSAPQHPYTKLLLSAVPVPDPDVPMNFNVGDELAKLDAAAR